MSRAFSVGKKVLFTILLTLSWFVMCRAKLSITQGPIFVVLHQEFSFKCIHDIDSSAIDHWLIFLKNPKSNHTLWQYTTDPSGGYYREPCDQNVCSTTVSTYGVTLYIKNTTQEYSGLIGCRIISQGNEQEDAIQIGTWKPYSTKVQPQITFTSISKYFELKKLMIMNCTYDLGGVDLIRMRVVNLTKQIDQGFQKPLTLYSIETGMKDKNILHHPKCSKRRCISKYKNYAVNRSSSNGALLQVPTRGWYQLMVRQASKSDVGPYGCEVTWMSDKGFRTTSKWIDFSMEKKPPVNQTDDDPPDLFKQVVAKASGCLKELTCGIPVFAGIPVAMVIVSFILVKAAFFKKQPMLCRGKKTEEEQVDSLDNISIEPEPRPLEKIDKATIEPPKRKPSFFSLLSAVFKKRHHPSNATLSSDRKGASYNPDENFDEGEEENKPTKRRESIIHRLRARSTASATKLKNNVKQSLEKEKQRIKRVSHDTKELVITKSRETITGIRRASMNRANKVLDSYIATKDNMQRASLAFIHKFKRKKKSKEEGDDMEQGSEHSDENEYNEYN